MEMIPEGSTVKEGDTVKTSGLGSVYPEGLPIGKVISVSTDPVSRTITAKIQPFTEFKQIKKVMIIKSSSIAETDEETAVETETEASDQSGETENAD
jgi:rod shape-determining protein MreC